MSNRGPLRFACPECSVSAAWKAELAGKSVECINCGTLIPVPLTVEPTYLNIVPPALAAKGRATLATLNADPGGEHIEGLYDVLPDGEFTAGPIVFPKFIASPIQRPAGEFVEKDVLYDVLEESAVSHQQDSDRPPLVLDLDFDVLIEDVPSGTAAPAPKPAPAPRVPLMSDSVDVDYDLAPEPAPLSQRGCRVEEAAHVTKDSRPQ